MEGQKLSMEVNAGSGGDVGSVSSLRGEGFVDVRESPMDDTHMQPDDGSPGDEVVEATPAVNRKRSLPLASLSGSSQENRESTSQVRPSTSGMAGSASFESGRRGRDRDGCGGANKSRGAQASDDEADAEGEIEEILAGVRRIESRGEATAEALMKMKQAVNVIQEYLPRSGSPFPIMDPIPEDSCDEVGIDTNSEQEAARASQGHQRQEQRSSSCEDDRVNHEALEAAIAAEAVLAAAIARGCLSLERRSQAAQFNQACYFGPMGRPGMLNSSERPSASNQRTRLLPAVLAEHPGALNCEIGLISQSTAGQAGSATSNPQEDLSSAVVDHQSICSDQPSSRAGPSRRRHQVSQRWTHGPLRGRASTRPNYLHFSRNTGAPLGTSPCTGNLQQQNNLPQTPFTLGSVAPFFNPLTTNLTCGPRLPPAIESFPLRPGQTAPDYMTILEQHNANSNPSMPPTGMLPSFIAGGTINQQSYSAMPNFNCAASPPSTGPEFQQTGMPSVSTSNSAATSSASLPQVFSTPGPGAAPLWAYQQPAPAMQQQGMLPCSYQTLPPPQGFAGPTLLPSRPPPPPIAIESIRAAQGHLRMMREELSQINAAMTGIAINSSSSNLTVGTNDSSSTDADQNGE